MEKRVSKKGHGKANTSRVRPASRAEHGRGSARTKAAGYPGVSVVIPTLNSERTLGDCLESIVSQEYPGGSLEIIIADGGSSDSTVSIVDNVRKKSGVEMRVVENRLKTGEAGKAAGLKEAAKEIIAFIDSDNILPERGWLKAMVEPFKDPEIVASEPIEYIARTIDGYITRYCAFMGMNDPLCLFLGNYDRYCAVTGRWTDMPHTEEDRGGYIKIGLDKKNLPTIGANGFLIRSSAWRDFEAGDYLFDIDLIFELLDSSARTVDGPVRFAKVKTGIIHIFSEDIKTFARKQRRRVKDYLFYSRLGIRKYPWKQSSKIKLARFIFSCVTVAPLLVQSIKGYRKKPDAVWLFHPVACWLTLWEYGMGSIGGVMGKGEMSRKGWSQ